MPKLSKFDEWNRKNDNVQSVLVSKFYNLYKSKEIVKEMGYNIDRFDDPPGGDYYRFRQFNPGSFRSRPKYKTVESHKPGVLFIIEY